MANHDFDVSVVMPTYNRADYIGETLAAVFKQTLRPAEVIVVDDGSKQDMKAAVAGFPVRYHRIANSGPSAARNAGLELARSTWIAFCDDDDLWRPTYLESFAALFAKGGIYGFGNFRIVREGHWSEQTKFDEAPPGFFDALDRPLYPKLLEFTPVWPSAVVARKDFIDSIGGFDQRLSREPTEDFEFTLRCNENVAPVVLFEPLVGIRKHPGNFSGNIMRSLLADARILAWARDNHRSGARYADIINREIATRAGSALDIAFAEGKKEIVLQHASLIPEQLRTPKFKVKLALSGSPLVPPALLRALFGRGRGRLSAMPGSLAACGQATCWLQSV